MAVSGGRVVVDVGEVAAVVLSGVGGVLISVVVVMSAVVVGAAVESGTVDEATGGGEVVVVAGVPEMRTAKSL